MVTDRIIFGAGLYGLYAALVCGRRGERVVVLEHDDGAFERATYINQARVHMGYHYPRSYSTAIKSAHYFQRFCDEFPFCVHAGFDQVYATSRRFSWSGAGQFQKFCTSAGIPCEPVRPEKYFREKLCDGAFLTREYTYDAQILKEYFLKELVKYPNVALHFGTHLKCISRKDTHYEITLDSGEAFSADFVLNATYAAVNQILKYLGCEPFQIKYELCEIIICKGNASLQNIGITVMDGPFFSIMPFGKTERHSLTAVAFTPHVTSYDGVPTFDCQACSKGYCSPVQLGNCNQCVAKPESAWPYMSSLARKYLREEYEFTYSNSLFSMKPILKSSEIDDSRPTVIRYFSRSPDFVSVLSGKINTVFDLDEVLTR